MLRAWGADRSLLSLVPQARRRAPRAFVAPVGIEAAAKEAVLSSPGDSREVIAKALHDRYGQPSLSWMRRLVAKVQRDHEREIEGGAAGFAKRIVVDSTALPLPLLSIHEGAPERETDEEDEFEWAVTALAWDAATGFILGRALDRAPADMGLHAVAAADASDCLRRMKLTVKSQVGAVVATTVPLQGEDAMETLRLMDRLSSDGAEIIDAEQTAGSASASEPVVATTLPLEGRDAMETLRLMNRLSSDGVDVIHSARAAGSELMKTFEGRIGKLELRPRFAADAYVGRTSRASALAKSGRIPMSVAEARVVIDHEIAAHNAAIMEAGLTAAVTPAIAADALDRVFRRYLPG